MSTSTQTLVADSSSTSADLATGDARAISLNPEQSRIDRLTPTVDDPTPAKLRALQRQVGYPMISVVISTTPDQEIDATVVARMKALLRQAELRMSKEMSPKEAAHHVAPLEEFASRLIGQRSSWGLALFGSSAGCSAWRVACRVEDRVVIDPTFATRDVSRSLALNPQYRLLVLGQRSRQGLHRFR